MNFGGDAVQFTSSTKTLCRHAFSILTHDDSMKWDLYHLHCPDENTELRFTSVK